MEKPKKRAFTFEEELEKLLEKHRFADWAVVVRAVDGTTRGFWVAGDGKNHLGDRERALILHGELAMLQGSMVDHLAGKTAHPPTPLAGSGGSGPS